MIGTERYDRSDVRQFEPQGLSRSLHGSHTLGNTIFGFEQTYFLFPTFNAPTGQTAISGAVNQAALNSMFQAKGAPTVDRAGTALNITPAFGIYLNTDGSLFLNQGQGSGSRLHAAARRAIMAPSTA